MKKKRRKETCCDNVISFVGKKRSFLLLLPTRIEYDGKTTIINSCNTHSQFVHSEKGFFFCSVGSFLGKEVIVLEPINLSSDGHSPKYVRSQSLWQCHSKVALGSSATTGTLLSHPSWASSHTYWALNSPTGLKKKCHAF